MRLRKIKNAQNRLQENLGLFIPNPDEYKGKVIEVTCMEVLPTGGLRHAKLVRFRPDLAITDCTWEKCFGE